MDELPKKEHRDKILDFLRRHPKLVNGLIDPASGQIFRVAANERRRILSFIVFLFALVVPVAFFWVFSKLRIWFPGQDLPGAPGDFPRLSLAYGALAIGSLAHMAFTAVKQSRSGTAPVNALEDWILWFHVKETSIITGVLSMWVALIGLEATTGATPATAFFVGYSLDSFVDLFLQRFEAGVSKSADETRKKLLPAGATA